VKFTFTPMNEEDARTICAWRYEGEYAMYNTATDANSIEDALVEMLDRRSPHFAVRDGQGDLVFQG
jgi:hypothetical protein